MSEQKETKNMKNAAEAQAPEQNTAETAAKQNDDAKQADTTEQQADAAAFQVVNEGFSTREAIEEAKRCLHCKIPQCKKGCPIGNDIPDFVHELSMGNMGAAMSIINAKSNLPAICGRVCPHEKQCQGSCVLGKKGKPVQIGKLEQFIADFDTFFGSFRSLHSFLVNFLFFDKGRSLICCFVSNIYSLSYTI